jgi:hypothetical protein
MRNRISYQNVALMVGPAPAFSAHSGAANHIEDRASKLRTLNLIQNADFNFNIERNEVPQIGGYALTARKVSQAASVNFGFSYLLSDGRNEDMLGFCISGQNSAFLSGSHEKDKDRNFFLVVTDKQEKDANLAKDYSNFDVLSFGNCFPVAYSLQASVGAFTEVNLEYSASNIKAEKPNAAYTAFGETQVSGVIPAINPENGQVATSADTHGYLISSGSIGPTGGTQNTGDIHYLRPGDIELTLAQPSVPGALLSGSSPQRMHINQVSLNVPIVRTDAKGFGSNYVTERKPQFPSICSLNFSATANNFNQENLDNIFTKDEKYNFTITFKDPTEGQKPTNKAIELQINDAVCQSQNFSQSIGGNMEVSAGFNFECTPFTGLKFSGIASLQDSAATYS